jgi:hypothetical protein
MHSAQFSFPFSSNFTRFYPRSVASVFYKRSFLIRGNWSCFSRLPLPFLSRRFSLADWQISTSQRPCNCILMFFQKTFVRLHPFDALKPIYCPITAHESHGDCMNNCLLNKHALSTQTRCFNPHDCAESHAFSCVIYCMHPTI